MSAPAFTDDRARLLALLDAGSHMPKQTAAEIRLLANQLNQACGAIAEWRRLAEIEQKIAEYCVASEAELADALRELLSHPAIAMPGTGDAIAAARARARDLLDARALRQFTNAEPSSGG